MGEPVIISPEIQQIANQKIAEEFVSGTFKQIERKNTEVLPNELENPKTAALAPASRDDLLVIEDEDLIKESPTVYETAVVAREN